MPSVMRLRLRLKTLMRTLSTLIAALLLFTAVACSVEQDRADAQRVADRIHSQLQKGDFASVYRESSPGFKQVGDESRFVSGMIELRKERGSLKRITRIAFQTGVDSNAGRNHTLVLDLEFDGGRARERMVLTRSDAGQMQLWDLAFDPIS